MPNYVEKRSVWWEDKHLAGIRRGGGLRYILQLVVVWWECGKPRKISAQSKLQPSPPYIHIYSYCYTGL